MSCRRGAVNKTIGLVSTKFFLFLHSMLAGHADRGCSNQVGPFHHNLNGISWLGVVPLEVTSAGVAIRRNMSPVGGWNSTNCVSHSIADVRL